jgi:hypothetical protein
LLKVITLVVSVASVLVSLLVGLLPFTNRDLDRAKKCLDLRERLGADPGDEYYDYLTESAKRSIFVDSYRREQKMASWAYPALMVELSPVFGWFCGTCRRGYQRSCDLASADFLVPFVAACLCVLTIALLFFRWRQNVLYRTKKESDSIAKGMVRTRLKFLNCQEELIVGVATISLVSYAIASMSYEVAAVICIADAAVFIACTFFRKELRSWWGRFSAKHKGKFWFALLFEDACKIEDYWPEPEGDESPEGD